MFLSENDLPDTVKSFGNDIAVMGREFGNQIAHSAAVIANAVADLKTYQPKLSVDINDETLTTWHNTVSTVETTISSFLDQVDRVVHTGERSIMEMIDSWEYSVASIKFIMLDGYLAIKYVAYVGLLITLMVCLYKTFRFTRKEIVLCAAIGIALTGLVLLPHSETSHGEKRDGGGLPVGAVVAFPKDMVLPFGWIKCDGGTVSKSLYPQLYARVGDSVPDLTGKLANEDSSDNSVYLYLQYGIKATDT